MKAKLVFKGGKGSGNFGHAGRPGKIGGSAAGSGGKLSSGMQQEIAGIPDKSTSSIIEGIRANDDAMGSVGKGMQRELKAETTAMHAELKKRGFTTDDLKPVQGDGEWDVYRNTVDRITDKYPPSMIKTTGSVNGGMSKRYQVKIPHDEFTGMLTGMGYTKSGQDYNHPTKNVRWRVTPQKQGIVSNKPLPYMVYSEIQE